MEDVLESVHRKLQPCNAVINTFPVPVTRGSTSPKVRTWQETEAAFTCHLEWDGLRDLDPLWRLLLVPPSPAVLALLEPLLSLVFGDP